MLETWEPDSQNYVTKPHPPLCQIKQIGEISEQCDILQTGCWLLASSWGLHLTFESSSLMTPTTKLATPVSSSIHHTVSFWLGAQFTHCYGHIADRK